MGTFSDAVDAKALRFALGFPVLLAAAFVVCAVLLRPDLPEPLAVLWTSDGVTGFASFPAFVAVSAGLIVIISWLVLLQAVPVSRPVLMRRIMMGTGISLSLFITAVLAAVLVGQAGVADARLAQVDAIVLAMGSGFALAMGVVVGFVFKADEQWSVDDDRALEQALELELDPDLARDKVRLWVHARSSVFVMLIVGTLFPASLIALALPWLSGVLVAVAAVLAAFLFARVTADRSGLRVFVAGFVRVMNVPAATISSAAASDVRAAEFGGWGYRSHGDTKAVLVSSGPAVVLKQTDGQRAVISGGNPDSAQRLAEVLSRVAARARGEGRS